MGAQTTLHLCYMDDIDFVSGVYYSDCRVKPLGEKHGNMDNVKRHIKYYKGLFERAKLDKITEFQLI